MSTSDQKRSLQDLRATHAEIGERLAHATVGTRLHDLLHDLHYHLGHVIEISGELLTLEERGDLS